MNKDMAMQCGYDLFKKHKKPIIVFKQQYSEDVNTYYDVCCAEVWDGIVSHHNVIYICTIDRS